MEKRRRKWHEEKLVKEGYPNAQSEIRIASGKSKGFKGEKKTKGFDNKVQCKEWRKLAQIYMRKANSNGSFIDKFENGRLR